MCRKRRKRSRRKSRVRGNGSDEYFSPFLQSGKEVHFCRAIMQMKISVLHINREVLKGANN
jgi:hypothetical protein